MLREMDVQAALSRLYGNWTECVLVTSATKELHAGEQRWIHRDNQVVENGIRSSAEKTVGGGAFPD